jgi:hypothetical protein
MNARRKLLYSVSALTAAVIVLGATGLTSVQRLGAQLDESANLTSRKLILFGMFGSAQEFDRPSAGNRFQEWSLLGKLAVCETRI